MRAEKCAFEPLCAALRVERRGGRRCDVRSDFAPELAGTAVRQTLVARGRRLGAREAVRGKLELLDATGQLIDVLFILLEDGIDISVCPVDRVQRRWPSQGCLSRVKGNYEGWLT